MHGQRAIDHAITRCFRRLTEERFIVFTQKLDGTYRANMSIIPEVTGQLNDIRAMQLPNDIYRSLRDFDVTYYTDRVLNQNSQVKSNLRVDIEEMVDYLYTTIICTTEEINLLQKKQSRSHLISDIFHIGDRDFTGGFIEAFQRSLVRTARRSVLNIVKHQVQNIPLNPNELTDVGRLLRIYNQQQVREAFRNLSEILSQIAATYQLLTADFVDYLIEKNYRNECSHFEDKIEGYARTNPQQNFVQFVTSIAQLPLNQVFYYNEPSQLNNIFQQYCDHLRLQ
ncbi:unnamed protein product [Adineta steineri]|uniref:Uncharacterized protein n=1 Tax=Adineta steineri TaxID=433720 RepID=A0A818TIA3_9BILA|nr:unnamed protein product [Adineta steineri]CAF3680149.1 unnamed protein product [Adineta steineri]